MAFEQDLIIPSKSPLYIIQTHDIPLQYKEINKQPSK